MLRFARSSTAADLIPRVGARPTPRVVTVALTRRTERFGQLAQAIEVDLRDQGLVLDAEVVDQILRNRIDAVAEVMRVTPRTALGYAPEDLPAIVVRDVFEAAASLPERMPSGDRKPRLRSVR